MPDLSYRVMQLESALRDLELEVSASRVRQAIQQNPRTVRLAKVSRSPSSGEKSYELTFVNGFFEDWYTSQAEATFEDRSTATSVIAYHLGTATPSIGDKVLAFEIGGRWWFQLSSGGTTTVSNQAADSVYLTGVRYFKWFSGEEYKPNAADGLEYPGIHLQNSANDVNLFYLGWKYLYNQQPWFDRDPTSQFKFRIKQPGMYQLSFYVTCQPFRVTTAGAPPSPQLDMMHYISFYTDPFTSRPGYYRFSDGEYDLTNHICNRTFSTSGVYSGSLLETQTGTGYSISYLDNTLSRYYGERIGVVGMNANEYRLMQIQSAFLACADHDYGLHVHTVTLRITRLATGDKLPASAIDLRL